MKQKELWEFDILAGLVKSKNKKILPQLFIVMPNHPKGQVQP